MNTNTKVRQLILPGNTFAKLTVVSYAGQNKHKTHLWNCRCECGGETIVKSTNLRSGHTRSCGCLPTWTIKHGHTSKTGVSPEYQAWKNMRKRCYNSACREFKYYGAKGITVCERWRDSFENFLEDMGIKPDGAYSLDRIDTLGNYEKTNCRWTTWDEQNNNKQSNIRVTLNGKTQTVMQWSRELSLPMAAIYTRINRGMSPEKALLTPILDRANQPRDRWGSFKSST